MQRLSTADLVAWKNTPDRKPLILQGARQVGKTYLLKEFAAQNFKNTYFLNFEETPSLRKIFSGDLSPEKLLGAISLALKTQIKNDADSLLILDEIQAAPEALTSLKYFYEHKVPIGICAAGSLLGLHLNSGSFPVGKVQTMTLYPLTFTEFLRGTGNDQLADEITYNGNKLDISEFIHEKLWEELKNYFVTGGLPEVINVYSRNKNDLYSCLQLVRAKQKEIISNYLADIAKHSGKVNSLHIESVWNSIHRQLATNYDDSVKRFKFKDALPKAGQMVRIAGPIDWLVKAKLALKIPIANRGEQPISAFTRDNIFKLFYFDIGILGAISDLAPEAILAQEYGTYKGYFAENFVAQEFAAYGKNLISWSEGKSEMEFFLQRKGELIPVEVKSGSVTRAQSLKTFIGKYSPKTAIILSGKPVELDRSKIVQHYPLYACEYVSRG